MNTQPTNDVITETLVRRIPLKIFGVGSAGLSVLEQVPDSSLCIAVGTSPEAVQASPAAIN